MTFLEPGQALPAPAHGEDIQWLSDEEVVAILDELPHRPMLAGKDGLRLSLAGAQDKLPVVFDGARIVLAPHYDALATAVYPTLTPKMAMKIGSKHTFSEVQARHWDQFAEGAGFTKAQAKRRILELARSLPPTARELQSASGHRFAGNAVVGRIIALIEQRCALTIRRLTDPAAENEAAAKPSA